jgi:hypothetical protein
MPSSELNYALVQHSCRTLMMSLLYPKKLVTDFFSMLGKGRHPTGLAVGGHHRERSPLFARRSVALFRNRAKVIQQKTGRPVRLKFVANFDTHQAARAG